MFYRVVSVLLLSVVMFVAGVLAAKNCPVVAHTFGVQAVGVCPCPSPCHKCCPCEK